MNYGLVGLVGLFLLLYSNVSMGQLVESAPFFPRTEEPVEIFFRADEGSQGLKDYTGQVYAHTGVITQFSTGPSNWRYVKTNWGQNTPQTLLERVEDNLYKLTIPQSIRSYYNVPPNEEILQMAFVFRSAIPVNGSYLEGKTQANGDIFVDVWEEDPGYLIQIIKPLENSLFSVGQEFSIDFAVSSPGVYSIEVGSTLKEEMVVDRYSFNWFAEEEGSYTIEILGPEEAEAAVSFVVVGDQEIEELPEGAVVGAEYLGTGSVRFVLEAPMKEQVFLLGNFSDWQLKGEQQLKKTPDGQYFWKEFVFEEEEILYQYWVDGRRFADPLSMLVLDPFNDRFISEATYPNMPQYPEGQTGDISVIYPYQEDFVWQHTEYIRPEPENLIIYELLLRDFFSEHDYRTLIDTLPYLKKLGVNAIEIMPNNEFDGNISWGYNPAYHMALDKYYGSPEDFKRFVDAAHSMDMVVLVDVVFNHVTGRSPLAQMYWNAAGNRPAANSPYLNESARHPFNVFNDMNHESESVQRYMDRCIQFLLQEYKIDGFRFDLSKGFTQRFTSDVGAWSAYDASRVRLLKRMRNKIREYSQDSYLILEHFGSAQEERELSAEGYLFWTNVTGNYHRAAKGEHSGGASNLEGALYNIRGFDQPVLVSYIESHDEQRVMYEVLNFGQSNTQYNTRELSNALQRVKTLNAFHYLLPGPKMLWQFGEVGYDFPINYCPNGTISENCRTAPKPIRWDYFTDAARRDLYNGTADIIHLRLQSRAFDLPPMGRNLTSSYKFLIYQMEEEAAVVAGNFDLVQRQQTLTFPTSGWYYDYFGGDSLWIGSSSHTIALAPGECKIYTNKKYRRPFADFSTSVSYEVDWQLGMLIYPNPLASENLSIEFLSPTLLESIEWYTLDQRKLGHQNFHYTDQQFTCQIPMVSPGLYLLKIKTEKGISISKIIKK
jgi:hypothetical protein